MQEYTRRQQLLQTYTRYYNECCNYYLYIHRYVQKHIHTYVHVAMYTPCIHAAVQGHREGKSKWVGQCAAMPHTAHTPGAYLPMPQWHTSTVRLLHLGVVAPVSKSLPVRCACVHSRACSRCEACFLRHRRSRCAFPHTPHEGQGGGAKCLTTLAHRSSQSNGAPALLL